MAVGVGLVGTVLLGLLDHVAVGVATALHPYGVVEENEVLISDVSVWAHLVLPLALLFGLQSRPETVPRPTAVQFRHRDFQRWLERPESARPPKLDDRADIPV
jgi:hypothetical protein